MIIPWTKPELEEGGVEKGGGWGGFNRRKIDGVDVVYE